MKIFSRNLAQVWSNISQSAESKNHNSVAILNGIMSLLNFLYGNGSCPYLPNHIWIEGFCCYQILICTVGDKGGVGIREIWRVAWVEHGGWVGVCVCVGGVSLEVGMGNQLHCGFQNCKNDWNLYSSLLSGHVFIVLPRYITSTLISPRCCIICPIPETN